MKKYLIDNKEFWYEDDVRQYIGTEKRIAFGGITDDSQWKKFGVTVVGEASIEEVQKELTGEESKIQEFEHAKRNREFEVEHLTVSYNGDEFDANIDSQNRLMCAYLTICGEETVDWVAHDNKIIKLNKDDLGEILKLAREKLSEIWVKPYKISIE